jgi:hypothetical protein
VGEGMGTKGGQRRFFYPKIRRTFIYLPGTINLI